LPKEEAYNRGAGRNCIMRSFIICNLYQVLYSLVISISSLLMMSPSSILFISPLTISHSSSPTESRDSSVGITLGYRLADRGSRIRFPVGAGNFSLHHCVQNGSGAHPASYPVGTRGSFPGGKAAGA
jgi:hypothetical protein